MSGDPISHVNVWSGDDALAVTWRGGSPDISVFVSADPDDAGTDVRPPDEPGRFVVAKTDARQYIHLFEPSQGFVVAAERRLAMDGPDNFRDLGGYPTMDGTHTRWGVAFRSDGLDRLTDDDLDRVSALGVDTIFDLRSGGEVQAAPDRVPSGIAHVHLPMSSDVAQQRNMLQRIVEGDLAKFDESDMSAGYLRMLEGFPNDIGRVVAAVAEGQRVLFHCTAGKDRTGIVAMVLLGLAGVADPYILDDYEISQQFRNTAGASLFAEQIRDSGRDPADFETMWHTPRGVMRATLEGLRMRWIDHDGYLRFVGVDEVIATRARANLRAF